MWWNFRWQHFPVNFLEGNSLKICHQNFTTFFTRKFTITKEICHLVLTLGAISRKSLRKQFPELFVQTVLRVCVKLHRRHAERVWENCLRNCFQSGLLGWVVLWGGFLSLDKNVDVSDAILIGLSLTSMVVVCILL